MKKTLLWAAAVLAVAGAGAYYYLSRPSETVSGGTFRQARIERGPLSSTVSSTGTLSAVVTVQVGSQISGQIKEIYADYNTEVKKDQMIARIDPESFELRVRQAVADLEAARATVLTQLAAVGAQRANVSREEVNSAEARRDYERKEALLEKNFISTAERDKALSFYNAAQEQLKTARAQLSVAEAQAKNAEALVKQREAQLAQSRVDLERTYIRAPVDGIVIKRSVDAGQTVAASLQAPELFVIAQNLADMEVGASVDEADVGRIRVGQRATFTVDSFPARNFTGEVRQVRKAAQVVQNVVTYTVVISTSNPDMQLLPGMTANVRIITEERDSVLKVPNAALRFRMPSALAAAGSSPPPAGAASTGPNGSPSAPLSTGQPSAGGPAGAGKALRQRLVAELKLSEDQQSRVDAILADLRSGAAAAKEAPAQDRARIAERNRAEMRERIASILTPEQKPRFAELLGDLSGRQATRGRVYVVSENGAPRPVELRLGISDGTATEILGDSLKEGDPVVVGMAPGARPGGLPRLPFLLK